jgi:hypothetical protein
MHKRIVEWRVVTREQIEAGWVSAGIMLEEHSIEPKDNFWKVEGPIIRTNSPISSQRRNDYEKTLGII